MKKILTVLLLSGSLLQAFDDTESMIDSRRTIQERAKQAQTDFKHLTVYTFSTRNLDKIKQAVDEGALAFPKKLPQQNLNNFLSSLVTDSKDTNRTFIEAIIRKGAHVNIKDECGNSLLEKTSSLETFKTLLENGANANDTDIWGNTLLHKVTCYQAAQLLLAHGADVNARDSLGCTPLHVAGCFEITQLLIKKGADVNAINSFGHTPLHTVKDTQVAQLLLNNGANVNAKDRFGNTPLDVAKNNPQLTELLIKHDAHYRTSLWSKWCAAIGAWFSK